ncbi:MAG: DUF4331 family protein [Candidatus Eremiobacteraeota bacterium]|nr:DUF4331 family protein [Candidatus Eremiobacteraeota bacterium]
MKRFALGLFAAAALIAGCGSDDPTFFANNNNFQPNNNNNGPNNPPGVSLRQIEQLARPGINEALLFTNAFLNTYNAVGPDFVRTALTQPGSQAQLAAQPVLDQAVKTLTAFRTAGGDTSLFDVNKSVGVFLPDVMRVDSSLFLAGSAYDTLSPVRNFPVGGRKLLDDVIDITFAVVLSPAVSDNVSYDGTPGNPATGHQPLVTTFPYLAPAN